MITKTKSHLWVVHFLTLIAPILLAGLAIILIGWPVRWPYPAAYFIFLFWITATGFICFRWRRNNSSPLTLTIANRAFVGFAVSTFILGFVFLLPTVADECGNIYYDYHLPAFNTLVDRLAEKLGAGAC